MSRTPQTKPFPALQITDIRPSQIEYLLHMVNCAYIMQEDVEYWFQIETRFGETFTGLGYVARDKFLIIEDAAFLPRSVKEALDAATPIDQGSITSITAWEVL